jgi:hypothetical protein
MSEQAHPDGSNDLTGSDREVLDLLAAVDVGGVLHETAAAAFTTTRRSFLRRSVGAAAGLAAFTTVTSARAASGPLASTKNDTAILQFDLGLEYLQAGLYTEAERLGSLTPKTLGWARVVGAHERAHVQAIKSLLGPRKTLPSPTFDYRNVTSDEQAFIKTAVAFEDLTTALLKWQAPRLDSRSILAAVATLHSVEARHAAWIRHVVGLQPATSPFDKPAPQHRMAQLVASTHFITSRPKTSAKRNPSLTG